MFTFDCKLIKTDITAIKYHKNYIYIGTGNFLLVYHKSDTDNCILRKRIFEKRKIHGIVPKESDKQQNILLIYGENAVKLLEINYETSLELIQFKEIFVKDWILTCRFIGDEIVFINMNNNLVVFDRNLKEIQSIRCNEKCILYSALIMDYNNQNELNELLAVSGTVFNEIIIWRPFCDNQIVTKLQSHNGVIFSLDYNDNNKYLCSTSDDRSAILWKFKFHKTEEICRVYGHESRVFRCKILENCFVTCGEDSRINLWSFNGELLRKIFPHSGGTIWSLDYYDSTIISGCSDGSVALFPIYYNLIDDKLIINDQIIEIPKHIGIVFNDNLVVITENGGLYYYRNRTCEWLKLNQHDDLKKYVIFQISNCRKLLALAGYNGQIYFYRYYNDSLQYEFDYCAGTRIYSLHWLNCNEFVICTNNQLATYLIDNNNCLLRNYNNLPSNKHITTTAYRLDDNTIIVGDRNGNILVYSNNNGPRQILKKAHNYLGVTKILKNNHNEIVTIGRDSMLKTFSFLNNLQSNSTDKLPLSWLCNYYNNEVIIGFSGDRFIVFDYRNKQNLLEINCGGGHRSWDFYHDHNQLIFVYIKNKNINLLKYNYNNIKINKIIDNYHSNIINKVVTIKYRKSRLLISGGEDTCLYLHLYYKKRLYCLQQFKIHLSNIRTIYKYELPQIGGNHREILLFTGGGRGQIIVWKLQLPQLTFTKQDSYYDNSNNDIRVMNLFVITINNCLLLFSGCSDGYVNIFQISHDQNTNKYKIVLFKRLFYRLRCLLKISVMQKKRFSLLLTCSTDGSVNFWDISTIIENNDIKPFRSLQLHQSGINALDYKIFGDFLILVTGGDDNLLVINYLRIVINDNCVDLLEIDRFNCNLHCAQITGIYLFADYCLSISIDQKLLINHISINNQRIVCDLIDCYYSSISDIQGFDCWNTTKSDFRVFLYGKGLEFVKSVRKG